MKFKLWRRRMSVSAPKMTIKTQMPWAMRMLLAILAIGLGGAIALWIYEGSRGLADVRTDNAREKIAQYKDQLEALKTERDQFSTTVNAAESQLNIERSAQKQLAAQVKNLESENRQLKEDLAFFESLLPNATGPQGVSIRRLKVDLIAPNQLRYRLLIMQGGSGEPRFIGNLQLALTTLQDGKNAMMTFPDSTPVEQEKFKLSFKYYQRVEGVLTLPEGVSTKMVQARVLEKGQMRAQLATNL
jgi:cell division protein FtsB